MKYHSYIAIIASLLYTSAIFAHQVNKSYTDQNDSTTETSPGKSDPFEGWTEEQYRAYEDSIRAVLYPPVTECHRNLSDIKIIPYQPTDTVDSSRFAGENSHVPDYVYISTSKAVGEIPIQSAMTQSGARTYTIPISVYPGMHGHQPELSLVYNSQLGNSVMGMGWSVNGVSSIERVGKNRYYDGKPEGVVMDNTDAFVLDGVRLIKLQTYSSYILYETEVGKIKVRGYYSGNVMKYFEAFFPNGNKAYYGSIYNQSNNELSYPVNLLSDIHNNTITYQYSYQNYSYRITSIAYNGASIYFTYTSTRPDPIITYSAGTMRYQPHLLSSIVCKFGATVLGTYTFSYTNEHDRSLLTQIDYSAEGQSFNPLKFYYGDGNNSSSYSSEETHLTDWFMTDNPNLIKVGRVKYDYVSDTEGVFLTKNLNPYWQHYRSPSLLHHSENQFQNQYAGNESIHLFKDLSEYYADAETLTTGEGFIDLLCVDLEGKQEDKMVKVNNIVANNMDQVQFKVYGRAMMGNLACFYTRTYQFNTVYTDANGNKSIQPKFYYPGDFNGDGKMEVLAVSVHQPFGDTTKPSQCYIFDLEHDSILFEGHVIPYNVEFVGTQQANADSAYNHTDRLFAMDYDGDGKTDLCHINASGTNIYTFDVSNDTLTARLVGTYYALKKGSLANHIILPGEFNGDGLDDILVSPFHNGSSTNWNIYNSKGNGQFDMNSFTGPTYDMSSGAGFLAHDINQDGLSDLVKYSSLYFCSYLNIGNAMGTISGMSSFPQNNSLLVPTDINAHSQYSSLACLRESSITRYSFSRNDTRERMMTGMANSLGVIEKNEYRDLKEKDDYDPFYHQTYFATFPFVNISEPVNVLTSSVTMHEGSEIDRNTYSYQDAILHRQGLGFLGFKTVTHYDRRTRAFVQTYDPENYGVLKNAVTPDMTQTFTYNISRLNNKTMRIRMTNKVENDLLKGNTVTTAYSYDTYDYPTQELATYPDGSTVKINNTYLSSSTVGNGYFLGFLIGQKTTTTLSGGDSSSKEFYIPACNNLLPTYKVYRIDGNQVKQEVFTYDSYGNMTSVSVTPFSSTNPLLTSYTYDNYGRQTQVTDHLGLTTSYSYNSKGRLAYKTECRGNTTTFTYDAFGRDSLTTYPDTTQLRINYGWKYGDDECYCIEEHRTGKPSTSVIYDALGRQVGSTDQRLGSSVRKEIRQYDVNGRLERVSLPSTGLTPAGWNVYTYDDHDRVVSYTEATGKVTTTSYNGNSVTQVENGRTTTKTYDPRGNLISVTDPAGTITYNLAPDGQPVSIVAPGGVTTNFSYDQYRRHYGIYEPNAGGITYTYDDAGNIIHIVNSLWQGRNYTYDSYNRLIGVSTSEFSSTYTYNNYNELVSVTSDNATSRTYNYDNFGRLTSTRETAPYDVWFQKDFTYRGGNIDTIRYTSYTGLSVFEKRSYYNGHLKEQIHSIISSLKMSSDSPLWQSQVDS